MCAKYLHGHSAGVLKSHTWRTAANSAAYLVPELTRQARVLDVGCGPGTITKDFAEICNQGKVIGVDASEYIIEKARQDFPVSEHENLSFLVGDVFSLPFADSAFDVVHAHQVLQHVHDPIKALSEMKRVCKAGGLVAVRDADFGGTIWTPNDDRLDRFRSEYYRAAYQIGGDPEAGRNLLKYAVSVGFADVKCTSSSWCFANSQDRHWWGSLWAERLTEGSLADRLLGLGLEKKDLQSMAQGFLDWSAKEVGWFLVPHGEIVCRK